MPTELPPWALGLKPIITVALLAALWSWESLFPLATGRAKRLRHAVRNIIVAVLNTILLTLLFGAATVGVATWGTEHDFGLLNWLDVPWPWRLLPAIVLLDGWLYAWHRLNHRIPLLWRFHRMHHADREMDVTTATRFHLGEHLGAAILRLGLIPLFGVSVVEILVFETLVVANTMLHHANVSVGPLDRPLRSLVVTPRMHQIHHSRYRPETDSNYSVLFSFWDRLFRSYRMRTGNELVELGLNDFDEDRWQTVAGMLKTPFAPSGGDGTTKTPQPDTDVSATEKPERAPTTSR